MVISKRYLVAAVAVVLLGVSCTDDATTTTTTSGNSAVTGADDVVFSSGVLPETIPDGFPVPQGSSIGSTMVVTKTGFTEVIMRIGAEVGISAEFFNQGLTQAGIAVDSSSADGEGWLVEFSDDGAKGTIELTALGDALSQAVIRYNVP